MKKILLIEDEPSLQKTLGGVLSDKGFEVFYASDGERGLELAKKNKPDIILLDLILPKKDGFEVLRGLQEDDSTRDIPVIIMTNLEGTKDVEKALEFGATTYLVKANYSLDDVVEKVKSILK